MFFCNYYYVINVVCVPAGLALGIVECFEPHRTAPLRIHPANLISEFAVTWLTCFLRVAIATVHLCTWNDDINLFFDIEQITHANILKYAVLLENFQ